MDTDRIVDELNKGNLVITPTDTIYGIMGDSENENTIRKIYDIKKRSNDKPLILLMNNYEMIKRYTKNILVEEEELIREFMPGLVTIILEKNDRISNLVTANRDSVGIRIPDNNDLLKIIDKLNRPVISTSANISDENVITSIDDLDSSIKNNVDYIYDGGIINNHCSTIVRFRNHKLEILRDGELSQILRDRFK